MTCLGDEIKRKLKLMNFKKVFLITKIVEFEIHSKKKKIKISQFVECLIVQDEKKVNTNQNLKKFGQVSTDRNLAKCVQVGSGQNLTEIGRVNPRQNLVESTSAEIHPSQPVRNSAEPT